MPEPFDQYYYHRDGTGRDDRFAPALSPESFRLDDRDMAGLLRFARAMARQLRYVGLDNREAGDWSNFPGRDDHPVTVEDMAAFLEHPERFAGDPLKQQWLSRPHFALFLVFLDLLRLERAEINQFTRRHLDYYYRAVLGLKPRPAEPDVVHLLLEPAKGVRQYRLEKGTLLLAGKTPDGRNRLFKTTDEIVVNRAKVSALKVFFQDSEYRPFETLLADAANIQNGHFLKVAVGDPAAGYLLPAYPLPPATGVGGDDAFFTGKLVQFLKFSPDFLFLSLEELRRVMALKEKIDGPSALHRVYFSNNANIKGINFYLEEAWRTRTGANPPANWIAQDWNFDQNFQQATGVWPFPTAQQEAGSPIRNQFQGIRHVQDLYERILDLGYDPGAALTPALADLQTKIVTHLRFPDLHRFMAMMAKLQQVQDDWKRLNSLLRGAAQRAIDSKYKDGALPDFSNRQTSINDVAIRVNKAAYPRPGYDVSQFTAGNIGLGNIADLQTYWDKLLELERYFQLPAGDVLFLLEKWKSGALIARDDEFRRAVELLQTAQRKTTLHRAAMLLEKQIPLLPSNFAFLFEELFGAGAGGSIPGFGSATSTESTLEALQQALREGNAEAAQYIREQFYLDARDFLTICQTWPKGPNANILLAERDALYQIAAAAVRRKNNTPLYPGEIRPRGFFSATDATLLRTGRPNESHPRWSTFGQQVTAKPGAPPSFGPAGIGFAVQSPLLWLSGGIRIVTLTLRLAATGNIPGLNKLLLTHFDYRLSNDAEAAGIVAICSPQVAPWDPNSQSITATFTLTLGADLPPVTAPHPDFFRTDTPVPVLKVNLRQDKDGWQEVWAALNGRTVRQATLSVANNNMDLAPQAGRPHHFFHLHPFGYAPPESWLLLPTLPGEGALYIGLEVVELPAVVNLLFQVAEGTADPDAGRRPVCWQYLAADGWRPRAGETNAEPFLLADDTDGLNQSGIMRFRLPDDADDRRPEMPPGRYWLRATIDHYRRSVCDLIEVQAQAVQAVRVLESDGADDPGGPLPPGTVSGLSPRRPEIRAVRQPYSSQCGRSPESDSDFYTRVSERLRHKQRALMGWDVERLLLEAFPDLYKVKCLPAGWQAGAPPGAADVVVIPNLRGRLPMDPFQPRLAQARLQEIEAWLQARAPIPAQYRVRNARFVSVKLEVIVQFHPGYDPGYYRRRLSDELAEYLSPWAFDAGADIRFGGQVYPAQLLAFIEHRPYVDFVTALKLHAEGQSAPENDFSPLKPDTPDTVWVSSPGHDIRLYAEIAVPAARGKRGVGHDRVGETFGVA